RWQHGGNREVDTRVGGERMVVVHDQQEQHDADDSAERRRRQRPLVDWYLEDLEHYVADRDVEQDQQEFHYRPPVLFSSSAIRRRSSSSSSGLDLDPASGSPRRPEKPHPRSGR